jgi:5-methylthioribose kinase
MNQTAFHACFPGAYFLDLAQPDLLDAYLTSAGRFAPEERFVSVEKAGEGNMNCTARVRTTDRTFILKQARPWVEKYPQIPAPADRALIEGRFYSAVAKHPAVGGRMPALLWMDEAARLLAFEDLGAAADYFPMYAGRMTMSDQTLQELIDYLSRLHRIPLANADRAALANHDMRALNFEHIFSLPMRADNGLNLDAITPSLAAAGETLKQDAAYQQAVRQLGERYLHGTGASLLHGDFFFGSFLQAAVGLRVIDPEFCFCGDAEFDLGVLLAHLLLAGEPAARGESALALYRPAGSFSPELARQYAGVEIMRRLLGVAQLAPLAADLNQKTRWLELSRVLVLEPGKPAALL